MTGQPRSASTRTAAQTFGYTVLGPILTEFSLRLWLYQRFFPQPDDAVLLFCARGGLRMRMVYEGFLARTDLPVTVPHESLMVSRLVAARTGAANPGEALLSELGREFAGRPMNEVAAALAQRDDIALGPAWKGTFQAKRFADLLTAADPWALAIRREIAVQDERFRAHLDARTSGRRTVILCDTGLYGSTVRLLRDGIADRRWFCLQFARSNYKRLATPHFDCTRGLSVESDVYRPWDVRTSALRFWHLIEAVLEPDLPSVRVFAPAESGATPKSNLEIEGWQERIGHDEKGLFSGAMAYVEDLDRAALPDVSARADLAWRQFRRAVVWPDRAAVDLLSLDDRSRDFGRIERVAQFAGRAGAPGPLARIRESLWREGAVVRLFPDLGRAGLGLIELAHSGRALQAQGRRMISGGAHR
ncbi:glycosyltransferase [Methylobacterium sp. BTF04]|uniref:glycosyltransferase n=1 Tax=Methylobacterium sp. BTF04 TaxID=2708300 RepID=UPI0013D04161|nr:glycosyltransferase [Methylobacterium sp. BTF04]NEU14273.1 glycosyltransferase [Methylobacterium sp. BTF04]